MLLGALSTSAMCLYDTTQKEICLCELRRLIDVDLNAHETANLVRDIFLFSCYTGLRFGDAMALTMENIFKVGQEVYLREILRHTALQTSSRG